MNDPPQREAANQDVIDMLIAISVVARHLAASFVSGFILEQVQEENRSASRS